MHNKLNVKLSNKNKKDKHKKSEEEHEEAIQFDLNSRPRVILFEGKVAKKTYSSVVQHTSKRYMILLNDVILVNSVQSSGFMTGDKLELHQVFELDQISVTDMQHQNPEEDPALFQIATKERPYFFIAESEGDKKIWLEELEAAICCIMSTKENKPPTWHHETFRGTIHSAAMLGEIDILTSHIKRLKEKSESVDVLDPSGMTPLHWAAMMGQFDAVNLLLDSGATIDFLNCGLNSPLLLAAAFGYEQIMFCLMNRGADINMRNLKDIDVLFMLVLYGNHSPGLQPLITSLRMNGLDLNIPDANGATPLHACASRNLSRPVQILVDAGADVNSKHRRMGLTPLHMACSAQQPDVETVRSFLEKGAQPNWRDSSRHTAFDMVMVSQSNRIPRGASKAPSNGGGSSSPMRDGNKSMKETVEDWGEFTQIALPVLMEIVRKGGRYSESSLANLRPSLKDAITTAKDTWMAMGKVEPDGWYDFCVANDGTICNPNVEWASDNSANHCLLCLDLFTFSNRRHHCRACGVLCCDLCSEKRLNFKPSPPQTSKEVSSKKSKAKDGDERVCDGCYNRIVSDCFQYTQALFRAKRDKARREEAEKKEQEENNKASLTSGKQGAQPNMTGQALNIANDTARLLEERGKHLEQTNIKAAEMNDVSFLS